MQKTEWHPFFYNGIETNVEVTKCGRVRKVKTIFYGNHFNDKVGEIDFSKLKLTKKGYIRIGIQIKGTKSKCVFVHQIIAAVFLGYKFDGMKNIADHKDNNKLNNNLDNIQIITNRENTTKDLFRHKKSGLPIGVFAPKQTKKYRSRIRIDGKYLHLGYFKTPEEASQAYQDKLKEVTNPIS